MSLYYAKLGVAGLSDVGYVWKDSAWADIGTRTESGVSEIEDGVYAADISPPATAEAIFWDSTSTPSAACIGDAQEDSGSGAYTITVTVTDGTDPLENAVVRLTEGVNQFTATTNASGEATFSLNAATYTVAVTKAGYQFTPTTRTVTGAETGTLTNDLEMTLTVAPPAPADPTLTTVYVNTGEIIGKVIKGLTIKVTLTSTQPAVSGDGRVLSSSSEIMVPSATVDGQYVIYLEGDHDYRADCHVLFGSSGLAFSVVDGVTLNLKDA